MRAFSDTHNMHTRSHRRYAKNITARCCTLTHAYTRTCSLSRYPDRTHTRWNGQVIILLYTRTHTHACTHMHARTSNVHPANPSCYIVICFTYFLFLVFAGPQQTAAAERVTWCYSKLPSQGCCCEYTHFCRTFAHLVLYNFNLH